MLETLPNPNRARHEVHFGDVRALMFWNRHTSSLQTNGEPSAIGALRALPGRHLLLEHDQLRFNLVQVLDPARFPG